MGKIKFKFIVSSLLLICLVILTITGIGLHFAPSGRIARMSNWTFLFMNKFTLSEVHTYVGFGFVLLIFIHFILNFKLFLSEGKTLFKK